MTSNQFEELIKAYKSEIKSTGIERPLTQNEIDSISESIGNIPDKYRNAFDMAQNGRYGKFESLPHLLRNYLGALAVKDLTDKFGDSPSPDDENVKEYLRKNAMNAAFRAGISAEKKADKLGAVARALDKYMNTVVLQNTMLPPTEAETRELENSTGADNAAAIGRQNLDRQLNLAKTFFLAQLGKYRAISGSGIPSELSEPLSETIVHGSRTNFILPAGKDGQRVIDAFMGSKDREGAVIEKRIAATHSVKRRRIKENGILGPDAKETRTYSPLKVFGNQYGMNIAIGGIGKIGPDGRVITGSGESGHVYIRAESGDETHCGSLLIGVEGSEPGKTNYLGHEHSILAKKGKQSAFVSDKGIVGKKVGGRQVDLSGMSSQELAEALNSFTLKYRELQQSAVTNGEESLEKLKSINDMLIGKPMEKDKLLEMFSILGMEGRDFAGTVTNARRGYMHGIKASTVGKNEFEQSIRRGIGQKEACKLAEERFIASGDDKKLAIGAVKELMYTHETRKRSWKIFHPFKNHDEKAKIRDLLDRLTTEKGVKKAEIEGLLKGCTDSFTLKYGEGLTNDSEAVAFHEANNTVFKKETVENDVSDKYYTYDPAKDKEPLKEKETAPVEPKKSVESADRTNIKIKLTEIYSRQNKVTDKINETPQKVNKKEL